MVLAKCLGTLEENMSSKNDVFSSLILLSSFEQSQFYHARDGCMINQTVSVNGIWSLLNLSLERLNDSYLEAETGG